MTDGKPMVRFLSLSNLKDCPNSSSSLRAELF